MAKRLNVVFDDEALYRAVKVEAARRGVAAKEIVAEAITLWLDRQEELDDLAASASALVEYKTAGGISAAQVRAEIDQILQEREGPA